MDKNIKIIYNKLENIKFNQGYVDLSNSSIQNENDIIEVCNIFRDPRYETFRIFYMKDNKIVAQEAITSKLPDCVVVFNKKTGEHIKAYEKMANRIKRLSADGYYLAHNHPSGIAKASKEDIQITKHFADNVNGFLGHIIIGSDNRYSIIEKDKEGRISIPEEHILDTSIFNEAEKKLTDNSFYNIKISSRNELIAVFMKMLNDKEYSTAILTDTNNNIRMVADIPNKMMNQSIENLNGFLKNLGRNLGANKVFIGTHNQKTYFKIIEHQRYGTFKDIVFIDNCKRIIMPKIEKSPNLFDKEIKEKLRRNRDAR